MDPTTRYPSKNRRTEVYGHQPPTLIAKNLWQGGWPTRGELERLGITAIINVTGGSDPLPEGRVIQCMNFTFGDDILPDLDMLHRVAAQGVAWLKAGERLLVHCAAGWNRSGLTTGLVLIQGMGMTGADAVRLIRRRRKSALGNAQFRAYLEKYELDQDGLAARMVSPFEPPVFTPRPAPFAPTFADWEDLDDDLFFDRHTDDYVTGLTRRNPLVKGATTR